MRIAFGTDEETALTRAVIAHLAQVGHEVHVVADGAAWPEAGRAVGEVVAGGSAERGVVCCFTGTGVSIAANKVAGVRAALCADAETARGARRWNDANVLAFGLSRASLDEVAAMLEVFLHTDVDPDERALIDRVEGHP